MSGGPGVFTLSLDTELAWGTFDVGRIAQYEEAYRRTPAVVEELCSLFETYSIPATWAVVSHLLVDCDGTGAHTDRTPPRFDWIDDWFGQLPCSTGLDRDLWYAPSIVARIRDCAVDQEVGLHGATHMQLGAPGCSRRNAQEEVRAGVATFEDCGIKVESFVYPRNDVRHVDVLAEHGIHAYRAVDARWYERRGVDPVRPVCRFADEASRLTPPAIEPLVHDDVVGIPGSQVFRPTQGGWRFTPPGSSVARARKGLRRAARTGRVFHLWFHPFNLAGVPTTDLERLERVLETARELADEGVLECRPMREVAALARRGRWS
jgi:hypothetical protein